MITWSRRRPGGFTILEVILMTFVGSVMLAALLRFLTIGFPLSKVTYLQQRSTEDARLELKRISKAIRELRLSDAGGYPLVETSPNRLVFYAGVDADALTERLRYELVGTTLARGVLKPSGDPPMYTEANEQTVTVATGLRNDPVTQPLFTYFSGDYPADPTPLSPADLTDVKYIQFHLVIDVDTAVDPPPVDVVSQVQLRNLKTNLGETVGGADDD